MPVTISYDLTNVETSHAHYIRSMLERFNWQRLGGSVFRYSGVHDEATDSVQEDWLNDVVPSLMFFRSYLLRHRIVLKFFTIDASGESFVDYSDPTFPLGAPPKNGSSLPLNPNPTNRQSSERTIRRFIKAARDATG